MGKWPNWKELKQQVSDPERVEEVRRNIENGRRGVAARLAGPAAHLRTVGQEFKSGLTQPEAAEPAPPPSAGPSAPPATAPGPSESPSPPTS